MTFQPQQNSANGFGIGPARLAIDLYWGGASDTTFPGVEFLAEAIYLFTAKKDGSVIHAGDGNEVIGHLTEGWNTIEMVLVPVDADGIICTTAEDTIASTEYYARVMPATALATEGATTTEDLAGFYHKNIALKKHYSAASSGKNSHLRPSLDTGVFKIRNAMAMNLIPYVAPEAGTTVGGYAFAEAGKYYQSNWANATIQYQTWGHWAANEGQWNGNVTWAAGYTDASFDAEGVLNLPATSNPGIHLSPNGKSGAGITRVAFDVYWDENTPTFSMSHPMQINGTWDAQKQFHVYSDGSVYYGWNKGATDLIGKLKEGWNTFELIYVPMTASGEISVATKDIATNMFYIRTIHEDDFTPVGNGYTESYLKENFLSAAFARLMQYTDIQSATTIALEGTSATSTKVFKMRNASIMNLSDGANLYSVTYEGTGEIAYVAREHTDHSYKLPTAVNTDKWLVVDTENVCDVKTPGETIVVGGNIFVTGAKQDASKFKGATISLGGEMTLNMKVDTSVITAGTSVEVSAIADGTALVGVTAPYIDQVLTGTGLVECYSIAFNGIRAADMATDLNLYVISKVDGQIYISQTATAYSPLKYIQRSYATADENVKPLLAAMAIYGAVAEENLYNTSNMRNAVNTLGITATDLPADAAAYTNIGVTQDDLNTINDNARVGAVLANGVNLVFEVTNANVKSIKIETEGVSETYAVTDTKATVTCLHAGSIRNLFTVSFLDANGEAIATANYAIGNFLETVRATPLTPNEDVLATAAINYMLAVRTYIFATAVVAQ